MNPINEISRTCTDVNLPEGTHKKYILDHFVDDPELYKAVIYACKLIDQKRFSINKAVSLSAKKYKKDIADVRIYLPRDVCEHAPYEDGTDYRLYVDISMKKNFKLVAVILSDHNMCCCETGAPYLLTKIRYQDGHDVYSCQCSCDGWCTNGHEKPEDAIREYESMCERYINRKRKKA